MISFTFMTIAALCSVIFSAVMVWCVVVVLSIARVSASERWHGWKGKNSGHRYGKMV
jgi:hypothetical protein